MKRCDNCKRQHSKVMTCEEYTKFLKKEYHKKMGYHSRSEMRRIEIMKKKAKK